MGKIHTYKMSRSIFCFMLMTCTSAFGSNSTIQTKRAAESKAELQRQQVLSFHRVTNALQNENVSVDQLNKVIEQEAKQFYISVRTYLNREIYLDIPWELSSAGSTSNPSSSLLYFAAQYASCEKIKFLVEKGADLEFTDNYLALTPLAMAARKGRLAQVRCLLDLGASIYAECTHEKWSVIGYYIDFATKNSKSFSHAIFNELAAKFRPTSNKKLKLPPENPINKEFFDAIKLHRTAYLIAEMPENVSINPIIKGGITPLHASAIVGIPELVRSISKSYPSWHSFYTDQGFAPIHLASLSACRGAGENGEIPPRYIETIKQLITSNPQSIHFPTTAGSTALHLAVLNKSLPLVAVLLAAGADPQLKSYPNPSDGTCLEIESPEELAKNDSDQQFYQQFLLLVRLDRALKEVAQEKIVISAEFAEEEASERSLLQDNHNLGGNAARSRALQRQSAELPDDEAAARLNSQNEFIRSKSKILNSWYAMLTNRLSANEGEQRSTFLADAENEATALLKLHSNFMQAHHEREVRVAQCRNCDLLQVANRTKLIADEEQVRSQLVDAVARLHHTVRAQVLEAKINALMAEKIASCEQCQKDEKQPFPPHQVSRKIENLRASVSSDKLQGNDLGKLIVAEASHFLLVQFLNQQKDPQACVACPCLVNIPQARWQVAMTPLALAVSLSNLEAVKVLLAFGAAPRERSRSWANLGEQASPLEIAQRSKELSPLASAQYLRSRKILALLYRELGYRVYTHNPYATKTAAPQNL